LHAWAARTNKAAAGNAEARGTGSARVTPPAVDTSMTFSSVPATDHGREMTGSGTFGGSLLPKILLVVGVGLAAYLVFSFIIGLLMTLLMVVGGVALLYGVYRIGRWRGGRDG
jgi:hypothetical protein